jgi:hypothetical protein
MSQGVSTKLTSIDVNSPYRLDTVAVSCQENVRGVNPNPVILPDQKTAAFPVRDTSAMACELRLCHRLLRHVYKDTCKLLKVNGFLTKIIRRAIELGAQHSKHGTHPGRTLKLLSANLTP